MKKILILVSFLMLIFITGCTKEDMQNKFESAILDQNNNIVIEAKNITKEATFINYNVDDVIVQFIAVKGTDGENRIAFNTCQACNPSPNAYFKQEGDKFVCGACGNEFHVDEVGKKKGGCNPTPVEKMETLDGKIIIDGEYAQTYKEKFENWEGPTK